LVERKCGNGTVKNAKVEEARLENVGPKRTGGKSGIEHAGSKLLGWKM